MGISREHFEEFLDGSRIDIAKMLTSINDTIAPRLDQSSAETEEQIRECIELLSGDDARKVAFGIFLVHDMMEKAAMVADAVLGNPERLAFMQTLLRSDSEDARNYFAGMLAAARTFDASSHLLCATILRAQQSIAERMELERQFGEDPGPDFILDLAQEIRRVDGNHDLGAAALAEALEPFLRERGIGTKESFVEWAEELEAGPLVGQWIAKEIRRRLGDA